MTSKLLLLSTLSLLIPASQVLAADASTTVCGVSAGDYMVSLSGFAGGSPTFYPIRMAAKLTVAANGDVKTTYKQYTAIYGGVQASKSVTGTLKIGTDCTGSLTFKDGLNTTHTFYVLERQDGTLQLTAGDVGMILSGEAKQ